MKKAQRTKKSRESGEQASAAAQSEASQEREAPQVAETSEETEVPQAVGESESNETGEIEGIETGQIEISETREIEGSETGENETDEIAEAAEEPQVAGEDPAQPLLPQVMPSPAERRALLEAIVYVAEEPLEPAQIAEGLGLPPETVESDLDQLAAETQASTRGIEIRKVAGGYKMFTKAEHHESIRQFVKTLRPKLRLSLPALETLAVVAYKQPVTVPEIQAIRGVNAGGVIHTLLNHKLITTAGRKKVIGRPMQYKTTKEFLVQFGLSDLSELPNLKELEELSRAALGEGEEPEQEQAAASDVSENGAGTGEGNIDGDPGEEAVIEDNADGAVDEEDSAESPMATAAASAAAAGAGRAGTLSLNDDSDEKSEA